MFGKGGLNYKAHFHAPSSPPYHFLTLGGHEATSGAMIDGWETDLGPFVLVQPTPLPTSGASCFVFHLGNPNSYHKAPFQIWPLLLLIDLWRRFRRYSWDQQVRGRFQCNSTFACREKQPPREEGPSCQETRAGQHGPGAGGDGSLSSPSCFRDSGVLSSPKPLAKEIMTMTIKTEVSVYGASVMGLVLPILYL